MLILLSITMDNHEFSVLYFVGYYIYNSYMVMVKTKLLATCKGTKIC
jgi:hypothetical protein